MGFAIAKIIGSLFIDFTICSLKTHGAETQIKTSVHEIALCKFHEILFILVISNIFFFSEFKSSLVFETTHLLSQTTMSLNQYSFNSFIIAVQAAHNQFTIIFISSFFFPVIFNELISHAKQTIAVPC
jgi:hypothetical protein